MRPPRMGGEGIEIALATHAAEPAPAGDDAPLVPSLAHRLSARVTAVPWDAPDADWGRFDAVVIRSTWDYILRRDEYLAWAESLGEALRNRPLRSAARASRPRISSTAFQSGGRTWGRTPPLLSIDSTKL
jgi:hypothetical protein